MLTWIKNTTTHPYKAHYQCSCGRRIVAFRSNVKSGHTTSCGCVRKQATSERSLVHGHKTGNKRTRTYVSWLNMKARCTRPSAKGYKNYGGRGITYFPGGESFSAVLADMGECPRGLTLDRADNNGRYDKDNCRWVTRMVQGRNKRNCVRYEYNGESRTLAEWSRMTGIGRLTILYRLKRGWSIDRALTEPPAY